MAREGTPAGMGGATGGPEGGREAPRAPDEKVGGHVGEGYPGSRAMQTRDRHDSGAMGDKVGVSDPAATPLGTDSETSGVREPEGSLDPVDDAPKPGLAESSAVPHGHARGDYERGSGRYIWMTAAAAVALLLALIVFAITVA